MVLGPVVSAPGLAAWWARNETSPGQVSGRKSMRCDALPDKRLQLTPNSSFKSVRGTLLAAEAVPQRWRSALLSAAEPLVR